MITIHAAIQTRLTGDSSLTGNLQTILGGSGRIYHQFEDKVPQVPCVVFAEMSTAPGHIDGDNVQTYEQFYVFRIFSNRAWEIVERLKTLLDKYRFPDTTEAGHIQCTFSSVGPDLFDEDLKVARKDATFRIYMVPHTVAPI
jgi:hypothetical protein